MANRLAARNGGPIGLAALVAILLLGLGLRAGYAWEGRAPVYDAVAYARIARNLDEGNGFTAGPQATQPSSDYSPGLPLLAAGLYELTGGPHERLARLALALVGTLSVLFTYLIGRRLWSPIAGLIGAGAIAIYPALLEYQGMLMGEPLAAALLAGAVLAVLWADRSRDRASNARVLSRERDAGIALGFSPGSGAAVRGRRRGEKEDAAPSRHPSPAPPARRWLVPGLLLGALVLVRPEYLGVGLLIALVVVAWHRRDWRSGFVRAGILLLGMAVVVAPWTIRNAVALDRFVPVSTGGGQVLFAGTYLPSGGDPEKVGAEVVERHPELFAPGAARRLRLEQILARLAAHRYPGMETDKALARMGREQLWDDVSEEPLEYAGFVAAKIGRIWSHGPREVMRRPLWEALHWALVGFGLLGLVVLARRRRREALLLAAIFLGITAISALLVASPRRVLVTLPLVAALAGIGVVWLTTVLRDRIRH